MYVGVGGKKIYPPPIEKTREQRESGFRIPLTGSIALGAPGFSQTKGPLQKGTALDQQSYLTLSGSASTDLSMLGLQAETKSPTITGRAPFVRLRNIQPTGFILIEYRHFVNVSRQKRYQTSCFRIVYTIMS